MIKIIDVHKSFKKNEVLNGINLELKNNLTYGLLGNNGVGKTTLLKLIFGEHKLIDGQILINDKKFSQMEYKKMYFFQESNELPNNLRVNEYYSYLIGLNNIKNDNIKIKKLNWIFNYEKYKKVKIKQLSAGERKLLSLFLMYILDPEIIFFDEPTANLDAKNKKLLIECINFLKKQGKLIVIITHLIEEVEEILDEVIIVKDGKIIFEKSAKEIENLKETYHKIIELENSEIEQKIEEFYKK